MANMANVKRILCPVDFSECSERAVDYAVRMSQTLGAELHVLHAYIDPLAAIPFAAGPALADNKLVAEANRLHREEMQRLQDMCAQHNVQAELEQVEGEPRRMIVEVAKRGQFDLIIMGTHGRTGAARALLGSIAERVLRTSPCPVLIVP